MITDSDNSEAFIISTVFAHQTAEMFAAAVQRQFENRFSHMHASIKILKFKM